MESEAGNYVVQKEVCGGGWDGCEYVCGWKVAPFDTETLTCLLLSFKIFHHTQQHILSLATLIAISDFFFFVNIKFFIKKKFMLHKKLSLSIRHYWDTSYIQYIQILNRYKSTKNCFYYFIFLCQFILYNIYNFFFKLP